MMGGGVSFAAALARTHVDHPMEYVSGRPTPAQLS